MYLVNILVNSVVDHAKEGTNMKERRASLTLPFPKQSPLLGINGKEEDRTISPKLSSPSSGPGIRFNPSRNTSRGTPNWGTPTTQYSPSRSITTRGTPTAGTPTRTTRGTPTTGTPTRYSPSRCYTSRGTPTMLGAATAGGGTPRNRRIINPRKKTIDRAILSLDCSSQTHER